MNSYYLKTAFSGDTLFYCSQKITSVVTTRFCNHFYHATKEGNCIPCNHTCEPGKILEQNCGYDAHGNRIPGKSMCKKCQQNEYSANSRTCLPCKECKDRQFKRRCTETADAICEDCPAGYVELVPSYYILITIFYVVSLE